MTYDAMSRIATFQAYGNSINVKDYSTPQSSCTYYPDHAQPHAVRKNTQGSGPPTSFCYDANGNLTTASANGSVQESLTWTSFNQPSDITATPSSSQFFYNADHQRYEQIASYSGSPETTFYVGGLLEKMINSSDTFYRHYIPAGNNTVVYTRQLAGANSTYYLTKDHLGSTAVITDSNGTSLVKEKFAALGWNEEATMAGVTRHEFTGQEGLDNAGLWLVNMNGRIYNPSGGRFLSPDPFIPDPNNTQSYNRYAYVSNNPLTMIDPSGYFQVCYDTTYVPTININIPTNNTYNSEDELQIIVESHFIPTTTCTDVPDPTLRPPSPTTPTPGGAPSPTPNGTPNPAQGHMPKFCVRNACVNILPPIITFCGGGGFVYGGVGGDVGGNVEGELIGLISYDSVTGGEHGGLIAGGIGPYTGGFEAMRTWSNWQETITPIAFANGSTAITPKNLGPLKISEADYGGFLQYDNGQLQIGGYVGGASKSGRAAGIGGYVSVSTTGSCPGQTGN
jgi:RHS repeat-associated protein